MFAIDGTLVQRETLRQAQAWCEEQEEALPLPKVGEVWGVPGKPESWKIVYSVRDNFIHWRELAANGVGGEPWRGWQSWLALSGAVRLDTMAARLAEAVKLLERWHEKGVTGLGSTLREETRRFLEGGK